ncbi:MAG: glycosyltransferase family 4 protein [Spirochaetales bacterium]|nr:glycosyltransferase family 4 protein [Spirochaetales bacterium]
MKIVQVSKRFVIDERGAPEVFFAETFRRLVERGISAEIFATRAFSEVPHERFLNISITRFPYFYPNLGLSADAKTALDHKTGDPFSFALKRALRKEKDADLIHISTGSRLGSFARAAAKRRQIPYVISLTGEFFVFPNSRSGAASMPLLQQDPSKGSLDWGMPLEALYGAGKVLEGASAIICSGRNDFTAASRKFPEKKVVFLPNGVDMKRFSFGNGPWFRHMYRIPEERFLILSVGEIDPKKNQLTLIRQLPDVLDKASHVHLLCIGNIADPSYYDRLLKEIALQKLQKRVTIIPGLPYDGQDLVNAYLAADCFVLPSLYEPFGMSVLEAWAAGLPVAAAKRGGPGYLVEHKKTGLLFDPEAPARFSESVKDALIALALDKDMREKYAKTGYKTAAERYSWDIITDRLLALYEEVVASSAK